MHPVSDLWFYAAAVPAVLLAGLSKGGFGGAFAMVAVPLMALVIPPVQAAGIMLPILVVMDIAGLLAYRGKADKKSLLILLPPAVVGIGIGWATASIVNEAFVRLLVGGLALLFVANYVFLPNQTAEASGHRPVKGGILGALAGFTSFVSHTGGPPFQLYMIPLRLEPPLFAGTAVIFFAAVNAIKVIPYFLLGQFDTTNLATSLLLLPLAPLATFAGVWLVRVINPGVFYRFLYSLMAVIGAKLVWDGLAALTS